MSPRALLCFGAVLAIASCSSPSGSPSPGPDAASPPLLGEDCDPIDPGECGFPFPSNVWRVPDAKTATGYHQFFGPTTLPQYAPGKSIDPSPWASKDGFSPGAAMMVFWPDVSVAGLPDPDHIAASTQASSPTLLIEYDTGALVPHWDEIDETPTTQQGQQAFFIRPALRLKDATRYLVAIRGVQTREGMLIPPSPAFQALRDGSASGDVSVGLRRSLYADILGKLASYEVKTSELQLAWDFTTASRQSTTGDMVTMRDLALAAVGSAGPPYTLTSVTDDPNPYIRRRINGTMTVPLFLTTPAECTTGSPPAGPGCPGSSIHRGADGAPTQAGTASVPFLVQIPNSLVNRGAAGPIIQNAHGLLGDYTEGQDGYIAEICDREGYVEIAVNLEGFASDDTNYITNVIAGDLGQFQHVVDRTHQGFINELLAVRMMMGAMATDPHTMPGGRPTIDPSRRFYRGDSQGGISGGVYMAISTDVTRGLMDNTGAPYTLLLSRSVDFESFFLVLRGIYPDGAQLQLGMDLMQQLWDNAEPDGYIPYITQDPLPGTPVHHVLIHDAIGDPQVTPLGAHFIARTVGARNLEATNRELFGLPDAPSGFTGNGLCEYGFGLPASQSPLTNVPPPTLALDGGPEGDPHGALRELPSAQDMADQFFRTGAVDQTCADGGPCAAPADWASVSLLTPASELDAGVDPDAAGDGGAQ
jgi:hypothetical protein